MKKFIFIIFLLCSSWASAGYQPDGEIPFPWGSEIPFPWADIEGIWQARFGKIVDYFSFHVIYKPTPTGSEPVVEVLELDRDMHTVLAVGYGFASSNGKLVQAVMRSDNESYGIVVRAYTRVEGSREKTYTVLTVRDVDGYDPGMHSTMIKLSDTPVSVEKRRKVFIPARQTP